MGGSVGTPVGLGVGASVSGTVVAGGDDGTSLLTTDGISLCMTG